MFTAAELPSAKAEYDDGIWPKPKVWPKNNFHIQPKQNIGQYVQLPTFGRQTEAELRLTAIHYIETC